MVVTTMVDRKANMEEKALVPTTTHEIDFYGDLLTVATIGDVPYVAIKPITDSLGLDWASQRQHVQGKRSQTPDHLE